MFLHCKITITYRVFVEIQKLNGAQSQALAVEGREVLEGPLQGLTNLPGKVFFSPDVQSNPPLAQPESFSSIPVTFHEKGPPPLIPGLQELGFGCCSLTPPCSRGKLPCAEASKFICHSQCLWLRPFCAPFSPPGKMGIIAAAL